MYGFIRFEWNAAKATANLKKHGVSFETAVRAFDHPFALSEQDHIGRASVADPRHGRGTSAAPGRAYCI
jgi:uncharacterized DUF497 family protein